MLIPETEYYKLDLLLIHTQEFTSMIPAKTTSNGRESA